jgi:hypothetical protein
MPLPQLCCPSCRAVMSLDVLLADDAPREALNAIVDAHPAGDTFIKPLLRYVGLFAPTKTQMSHSRLAGLVNELAPMIRAAKIEHNGRTWPCPIDYWRQGFEYMLAQRDLGRLILPLKSHGYLFEVLVGLSDKAESRVESHTERQRQGHAGLGTPEARASPVTPTPAAAVRTDAERQRTPHVNDAINTLRRMTKELNTFSNQGTLHD